MLSKEMIGYVKGIYPAGAWTNQRYMIPHRAPAKLPINDILTSRDFCRRISSVSLDSIPIFPGKASTSCTMSGVFNFRLETPAKVLCVCSAHPGPKAGQTHSTLEIGRAHV